MPQFPLLRESKNPTNSSRERKPGWLSTNTEMLHFIHMKIRTLHDGQRSKYQVTPNNPASTEENLNLGATRPRGWGVNGQARALRAELPGCAPQTPEPASRAAPRAALTRVKPCPEEGKAGRAGTATDANTGASGDIARPQRALHRTEGGKLQGLGQNTNMGSRLHLGRNKRGQIVCRNRRRQKEKTPVFPRDGCLWEGDGQPGPERGFLVTL